MRNDDDTLHDRLARAMMGRNFFSELQKSPERKCPMCTDAKKDREREMGHLMTHSDDDSGSTSSGGIVARRRFVEVERRSLRQVLLDDSGLICQYLAYCTRADNRIQGVRLSCKALGRSIARPSSSAKTQH